MNLRKITGSLRFKLIISSVLIQIVFISILVSNSQSLIEDSLLTQAKLRELELERLLSSAIADPFVQQDYDVIQDIFRENTINSDVQFLELKDVSGTTVVTSDPHDKHMHSKDLSIAEVVAKGKDHYHGIFDIRVEGIKYGEVRYGISTAFFVNSISVLLKDSIVIAALGIVLSSLALFFIGFWLTRNLARLTEASQNFAAGNLSARVSLTSEDEVSDLGHAFNNMADTLETRISDLKNSREKQRDLLELSNAETARLSSLLAVMTRGIVFVTNDNYVKYYNPAFARIWGVHESVNLQNKKLEELCVGIREKVEDPVLVNSLFGRSVLTSAEEIEFELINGSIVSQRHYPILDDSRHEQGALWIFEDVTEERQTAKQLVHLAEHDFLTGLHNRRKFHEELVRQISNSERHKSSVSLLFFDVDDFKYINDAYGHQCGDELLIKIAGDVGTLVRKNEMFCRLGGDEFAIMLPDASVDEASRLAQRILTAVSNIAIPVEGQKLSVTSSIGIAVYPDHATNSEELLACADVAMYQAKEAGKNTWRVYELEAKSTQHLLKRIDWDNRIKHALDNDGFNLKYQGIYDAGTRELKYYETLVRMKSQHDGVSEYLPGQFINFAERFGTIIELDRMVIDKVVQLLGENSQIPCLAVNISGRSFDDPSLEAYIVQTLEFYNVNASRLMIELTETSVVSDLHDAQRFINSIQQYGCKVAIDDFGAGYSSFLYLKHLNVDVIKIDGLFTHSVAEDLNNQLFIKAIVDIAKGLGCITVAEFVEDEVSLQMLISLGVDMVQGFYFEEPKENVV